MTVDDGRREAEPIRLLHGGEAPRYRVEGRGALYV